MGTSAALANKIAKLFANGTAIANIADNAAASPATQYYLALHTADPGAAGTQATSETAYTGYARLAAARTSGGLVVTANAINLAADRDFPVCAAAPGAPITHWSIGLAGTGAGEIEYSGPVAPNVTVVVGLLPRLLAGTSITFT